MTNILQPQDTTVDSNIFPEYYEKIKIREIEDEIHILLHEMELYLWDKDGLGFDESGGEFKMVLYLRKVGDTWEIY